MRISPISNNTSKPNFGSIHYCAVKRRVGTNLLRHFGYLHDYGLEANYNKKSLDQKLKIDQLLDKIKILMDSINKEGIEKCFKEKLELLEEMCQFDRMIEFEVERGKKFFLEKIYNNTVDQYLERMSLEELKQIKNFELELSKLRDTRYCYFVIADSSFDYNTHIYADLGQLGLQARPTFIPSGIKYDPKSSKYNLITHVPSYSSSKGITGEMEEIVLSFDDIKKAQDAYDYLAGLRDKYENGTDFDILNWAMQGFKFYAEHKLGTEMYEHCLKRYEPVIEDKFLDQIITKKESLARRRGKQNAKASVKDTNSVEPTKKQKTSIKKVSKPEKQDVKAVVKDANDVKTINEQKPIIDKDLKPEKQDTNIVVKDTNSVKTTNEQKVEVNKVNSEEKIIDNKNNKEKKETFIDWLLAKIGLQRIKK